MKQRLLLIAVVLWLTSLAALAQEEPEYRMEVGGGAGLAAYEGDLNGNLFSGMQPMGALVAKYKPNPRMAWALQVGYTQLKGSSANTTTWYPDLSEHPVAFSRQLADATLRYEYNFWAFGTGREYYGARRLTPFIALGLGLAVATGEGGAVAAQLPIGGGVKYKLAERLNLTAEWTMHFTGTDKIDGVVDPYGIKSSGLFKNTDCYSLLQLSLTYDIWAKCKVCHNDRD